MSLRKIISSLFSCCQQGKEKHPPLEVGAAVPDLPTTDQDGQVLALHERLAAASFPRTLLYFYPKSDTPG